MLWYGKIIFFYDFRVVTCNSTPSWPAYLDAHEKIFQGSYYNLAGRTNSYIFRHGNRFSGESNLLKLKKIVALSGRLGPIKRQLDLVRRLKCLVCAPKPIVSWSAWVNKLRTLIVTQSSLLDFDQRLNCVTSGQTQFAFYLCKNIHNWPWRRRRTS